MPIQQHAQPLDFRQCCLFFLYRSFFGLALGFFCLYRSFFSSALGFFVSAFGFFCLNRSFFGLARLLQFLFDAALLAQIVQTRLVGVVAVLFVGKFG